MKTIIALVRVKQPIAVVKNTRGIYSKGYFPLLFHGRSKIAQYSIQKHRIYRACIVLNPYEIDFVQALNRIIAGLLFIIIASNNYGIRDECF
ncbi:MAG: hypothetical protein GQ574_21455 [Crocinitomix sp.]|nr:hypothetical protein [Crocinitomix sp.]